MEHRAGRIPPSQIDRSEGTQPERTHPVEQAGVIELTHRRDDIPQNLRIAENNDD